MDEQERLKNDKTKHLEFVEGVIERMNHDSFLIRGWMITLVSAFFAFATTKEHTNIVILSCIPIIAFWLLDTFYLLQERKYRALYDDIIGKGTSPRCVLPFDMSTAEYKGGKCSFWNVFFSRTILQVYGIFLALVLVLIVVMNCPIFRCCFMRCN